MFLILGYAVFIHLLGAFLYCYTAMTLARILDGRRQIFPFPVFVFSLIFWPIMAVFWIFNGTFKEIIKATFK